MRFGQLLMLYMGRWDGGWDETFLWYWRPGAPLVYHGVPRAFIGASAWGKDSS